APPVELPPRARSARALHIPPTRRLSCVKTFRLLPTDYRRPSVAGRRSLASGRLPPGHGRIGTRHQRQGKVQLLPDHVVAVNLKANPVPKDGGRPFETGGNALPLGLELCSPRGARFPGKAQVDGVASGGLRRFRVIVQIYNLDLFGHGSLPLPPGLAAGLA